MKDLKLYLEGILDIDDNNLDDVVVQIGFDIHLNDFIDEVKEWFEKKFEYGIDKKNRGVEFEVNNKSMMQYYTGLKTSISTEIKQYSSYDKIPKSDRKKYDIEYKYITELYKYIRKNIDKIINKSRIKDYLVWRDKGNCLQSQDDYRRLALQVKKDFLYNPKTGKSSRRDIPHPEVTNIMELDLGYLAGVLSIKLMKDPVKL